jgi:hypothetical protein
LADELALIGKDRQVEVVALGVDPLHLLADLVGHGHGVGAALLLDPRKRVPRARVLLPILPVPQNLTGP